MPDQIKSIIDRISALQTELEKAFEERKKQFGFTLEKHKVRFQKGEITAQRKFKRLLITYIFNARLLVLLTAPVIYSLVLPLALLDLFITIYQHICFPVYQMEKVKRGEHIVLDRHKLGYLNTLEKINCAYCGYGNGVLAYAAEIAARTESYWCPIKHARKMANYHHLYGNFSDYGDAENYLADLKRNMEEVRKKQNDGQDDEP